MTDKLAKQKTETALTTPNATPLGLEAYDDRDNQMPRRKIVQPTSKDGTAGTFSDNMTGEEVENMHVVLLSYTKCRIYWPPSDSAETDPLCKSDDSCYPAESIEAPLGERCGHKDDKGKWQDDCQHSKWNNRTPPACGLSYQMLFADIANEATPLPFVMTLGGAQIRPVKGLIAYCWQHQASPFSFSFVASLDLVKGDKGKYYTIRFSDRRDEGDKYLELHNQLLGVPF